MPTCKQGSRRRIFFGTPYLFSHAKNHMPSNDFRRPAKKDMASDPGARWPESDAISFLFGWLRKKDMVSDFASWAPARPRFWPPRLAVRGAQNDKMPLKTLMKTTMSAQNGDLLAGPGLDRRLRKKDMASGPGRPCEKKKIWRQILTLDGPILTPYLFLAKIIWS